MDDEVWKGRRTRSVLRHEGARGNSKTDRLYSNVTSLELNFCSGHELARQPEKCSKKPWESLVNCMSKRRRLNRRTEQHSRQHGRAMGCVDEIAPPRYAGVHGPGGLVVTMAWWFG